MPRENQIPVASFAPDLTDETLAHYRSIVEHTPDGELSDALRTMLACVEKWWELPESTRKDGDRYKFKVPQVGSDGAVAYTDRGAPVLREVVVQTVPLEREHVAALDSVTPWMRELDSIQRELLDPLPAGELRNAAFHLLWYCKEITLDREPMTRDRLKKAAG